MEVRKVTSVSEHWNRYKRTLLVAFSRHTYIFDGDRWEAPASQLQLICRYSVDRAPLHHAGLLSLPWGPYLLVTKHTTLDHHSRHYVSIDHCNTAFMKLLTLNIQDITKLAFFKHQISLWNIISICFILHISVVLESFLCLMYVFHPCMPGLQRYEFVDISSWAAFNIGKIQWARHYQPLVPI